MARFLHTTVGWHYSMLEAVDRVIHPDLTPTSSPDQLLHRKRDESHHGDHEHDSQTKYVVAWAGADKDAPTDDANGYESEQVGSAHMDVACFAELRLGQSEGHGQHGGCMMSEGGGAFTAICEEDHEH